MGHGTVRVDNAPGTLGGVPALWAWIAIDSLGGEGIVAEQLVGLGITPFVTGREHIARGAMAEAIKQVRLRTDGRRFELRRYDLAGSVDVVV